VELVFQVHRQAEWATKDQDGLPIVVEELHLHTMLVVADTKHFGVQQLSIQ
jgi:hypothetical protein